jgi:hypothetical protein
MCYSVASSARTTAISLLAIVYLLQSKIPHFQWIGVTLIGWCGMQFAELLLWMTEPRKGCTQWNKIITLTLIPLVLLFQPVGSLLGSLYVIPWSKSDDFRKNFIIFYSLLMTAGVAFNHFYKPYKLCTTLTENGHLFWCTTKLKKPDLLDYATYYTWAFLIALPLIMYWDKSYFFLGLLCITPLFGFIYGKYFTDSGASIWCYYTSYTSAIAIVLLFLKQTGIYSII